MRTISQLNRRLAVLVVASAAVGTIACGKASNPTAPTTVVTGTVTAISVTSNSRTSSSAQLTATARMSDGTTRDVTSAAAWQSSNAALASVSQSGLVTFFGSGELDIRATFQNVSGTLHLLVANLPVTALTISGAPATPATSFQLTAIARLSDGSTQDVTRGAAWESSNPAIATVANGIVSVVSDGEADIRATYQGVIGSTHLALSRPHGSTLTGFVTDATTSLAIAGVRVQLIGGGSAQTDEHGAFGIAVNDGRALVEFSKSGYQTFERDVTINGDTQMLIKLTPLTGTTGAK